MINITTAAVDTTEVPLRHRNSFRLTLLFIFAFLAFFILFTAYNVFVTYAAQKAAELTLPAQPQVIQVDPKMESELAKVMSFEEPEEETAAVSNPFLDRGNISGTFDNRGSVTIPLTTGSTGSTGSDERGSSTPKPTTVSGGGQNAPGPGTVSSNPGGLTKSEVARVDTKARYEKWRQNTRLFSLSEPEPGIFAVEDLIPVGVVSGGTMQEEVLFYSLAAGRTMSFPLGTRFHDAWLKDVTPDGVIFDFFDAEVRSIRLKTWGRSLFLSSGKTG